MSLRLAFTGTGTIAHIHALAVEEIEEAEIVAIVNHSPASANHFAERYKITRKYEKIAPLIHEGGIDALIINTPNYLHASQAIAALEAGIHVMVEKPMAMTVEEAQNIIAASEKSGARLMVAHCWRFDEEVQWLRDQLREGKLGAIIRTKGYGIHTLWGPEGWFTQKRLSGGGALADMGIHAIDTTRYLLHDPKPVRVFARVGTYYGSYDVDDTAMVMIDWDNGVTSFIESGWWQPHSGRAEASTELYGTEGYAQVFPTHLKIVDESRRRVAIVESGFSQEADKPPSQKMYNAQMAYFVKAIQHGLKPVPGGQEGLVNLQIIEAAYESSRSGQLVTL
ncbi:MAG: Gfo/Idh/MocA family oxidoreductase [Anaerolineae bacterium]|nr:Gfo/Idh/MocA family oxidoreductase [Anaerolineae bacterium]